MLSTIRHLFSQPGSIKQPRVTTDEAPDARHCNEVLILNPIISYHTIYRLNALYGLDFFFQFLPERRSIQASKVLCEIRC